MVRESDRLPISTAYLICALLQVVVVRELVKMRDLKILFFLYSLGCIALYYPGSSAMTPFVDPLSVIKFNSDV